MVLDHEEAGRIEAAVQAAQARSAGPIVCVLARQSSNYEAPPLIWSALVALAAPWPLLVFTPISAEAIYLIQLVLFLAMLAVLSLPRLRPLLTPRAVRRAHAHRAALEQFTLRGVSREGARNGVLIYVSLIEHYARIVADADAARAIPQRDWQGVVDRLLDDMRAGPPGAAIIGAAERCGDLLAPHFPPRASDGRPAFHRFHML